MAARFWTAATDSEESPLSWRVIRLARTSALPPLFSPILLFNFQLRPRMKLPVHLAQARRGDVRINFRGADAGVPQQFLDDPQVCAVLEQMRGETVPQHMRRDVPSNP